MLRKRNGFFKPQFFHLRNKDKSDLTNRRVNKRGKTRILSDHCGLLGLMGQDLTILELRRDSSETEKRRNETNTTMFRSPKW